ncbi:MAG: 3-isopropylmalate dehydratase small subunit [Desulfohalobiaceae bacterium]|nr:3-isopropylmalate dehydratase small subunit [Desulfohalobiaceae bacterium]
MFFQGKAHKLGAHIDTDAIIPAKYLVSTEKEVLGRSCMAGIQEDWVQRISPGDIIVADKNFGCGSSREHAPLAILGAGIPVVIAHSFARIFYRNGFNMGLVLLEIGDDVHQIDQDDHLKIDALKGLITDQSKDLTLSTAPLPEFMRDILSKGGLVNYVRERLAA